MKTSIFVWAPLAAVLLSACTTPVKKDPVENAQTQSQKPFASTYQVPASSATLIQSATVLTGDGQQLDQTDVLVIDGKISRIGKNLPSDSAKNIVDGRGKWLTPGLIDVHSHMGVYPAPETSNHADGNEMTSPVTAEVWAEHSVWPQDPQYEKALAGGITTFQVLPGSANLFGGRGVTLKNVASVTVQGMKFPDAPHSLKMACGENPKRVYGGQGRPPQTRMGNVAGFRNAWIDAVEYRKAWDDFEQGKSSKAPKRNLKLETLKGVLDGDIRIHNHCYRADEMAQMIDLSKEFGYSIAAFHHAVEAYKIAPLLKQENICAVMWADWWGFKQEAFDMVRENIALVDMVKACAVIHSDDGIQVQRLNQEIAKAMVSGNEMGLDITRAQALRWVTLNAAKSLGLDDKIGSISEGKNADLVLWSADPFSVYAKADQVWIDGVKRYDLTMPGLTPTRDFNLGVLDPQEDRP